MKLELKHLAPYLPYGLNMHFTGTGKPFRGTKRTEPLTVKNIELLMFSDRRKPILRPLSDLVKEIETEEFGLVSSMIEFICSSKKSKELMKMECLSDEITIITLRYWQIERLLKYHFDIFGLIEHGLAIDINTHQK